MAFFACTLIGYLTLGVVPSAPATDAKNPQADVFHDRLIEPSKCHTPPAQSLSRVEALEDLAVVERVLRQGYAGYDVLARAGIDWDLLFNKVRTQLSLLKQPIPVALFQQSLVESLSATHDGHLAFWSVAENGKWNYMSAGLHEDAYTADVRFRLESTGYVVSSAATVGIEPQSSLIDCKGQYIKNIMKPAFSVAADKPEWILVVLSASPPDPLKCEFRLPSGRIESRTLKLRRLSVALPRSKANDPSFEMHKSGNVAVIRLRRLDATNSNAMASFVTSAVALNQAKGIVIDARGNPGGRDNFVADWFLSLTSQHFKYHTINVLDSDVTRQGEVNYLTCLIESPHLDELARKQLDEDLRYARLDLENAKIKVRRSYKDWRVREPALEKGTAPKPFAGTLAVLVDASCASSCESLVMYAKQLSGAVIVGENTAGVGVFGEVRRYRLPNSGLFMQASRKWFHDADLAKVAKEGQGYLPDIWLDTPQTETAAEAIASCLENASCLQHLRQHTAKQPSSRPAATIELRNLTFDGEVLQGEVVNRNGPTVTEVLVEVTFGSENDKAAVTQTFRVVPGGDGRTLSAGMIKHFRYRVKMGAAGQKLKASGKVTKVLLAQDEKQ